MTVQSTLEAPFTLGVFPEGEGCFVHVAGDLDLGARNRLFVACTAGSYHTIVIDMSWLTFIDCSGYGGIVAARNVVEADGRRLEIRGATGQPAHFLDLIADIDRPLD